ncbi:MAG: peptidase M24 family protein [Gordonia sp.]|uniref:Xaa-Pro peptidase family protein n=1 Tax=Gordonia rubripertincta TaxID=36822 RepID=A0ABT4MU73_GORRU|nr:Xaa-Pro peptidase family protein [Gordonia rubripertincta]MBA4020725.1 peptidase M24 family protein [Gordonia sp. (in: high G+C Gram-positive bacteria)]MCZ4550557.1 Xaa-Pro peptidase family protein [Gordonia rubripertincta]
MSATSQTSQQSAGVARVAPDLGPTAQSARRDLLRAQLDAAGVDAVLITDLINLRYLTGFTGSNGALVVTAAGADTISTDGRYLTQVSEQAPDLSAIIARDCPRALIEDLSGSGARIGFEKHIVTVATHQRLVPLLAGGETLVGVAPLVEELRIVKDEYEVEQIRTACQAADLALADIIADGLLVPGRTERQVARALEWAMFERGAEAISFETIVATGANSAIPHHRPTDAELSSGDLLKIDFGAVVEGYHSDMTRTYVLETVQPWQRDIYEVVAAAQLAGREALEPGVEAVGVDAAARSIIDDAGFGEYYVHGLGHGVGLQIHEAPSIGALSTGTLPCGAAVTVEPGVYLPGRGGVRIEDTLVVRDGEPELLTTTDKTFTVI